MSAFFELKPNKILSFTYTTYPSYTFSVQDPTNSGIATSSYFNLFDNFPTTQSRNFYDVYGNFMTGNADYSGSVIAMQNGFALSNSQYITGAINLLNLYNKNALVKTENWDGSFLNYSFQSWYVINIPSVLYGTEIKPGSFQVSGTGNAFINDDGFGGIKDITNTQIGWIFYQHGIALFPVDGVNFDITNFQLSFSGTYKIPENIYILDLPKGEANFSTNPSYTSYDTGSQQQRLAITDPKTYPATIGLYNEDYELLGVAKLGTPIYHDEKTPAQIRLKLNF